ncbi:MAG TPA: class I SAM-dependent methyltransferase [Nitrospirae bacterium]|nr:class I SAM-dependent methyltransferase [Nitrospirota bacterium]
MEIHRRNKPRSKQREEFKISGINNTTCRVCGEKHFSIWGRRDDQTLYQCQNCELVFFFPYPTQEELDNFYNTQYHAERGYGGGGEAGRLRRKMYELDINDLEKKLPAKGRFLDVGCAEGVFLSMLNEQWEKYGIDISAPAIMKAREKEGITAEVKDISDMEDSFFDVIHLRGVFEHFLDPIDFVLKANRKLKNNGTLVLSNTPNAGGLVPRLFRGRFKLVLPNEHLNYFSVRSMQVLSEKAGFYIKKIKYPYFGSPYCSFWKNLFEIPFNLAVGKQSPPFWGNIFTVYAQKVKDV